MRRRTSISATLVTQRLNRMANLYFAVLLPCLCSKQTFTNIHTTTKHGANRNRNCLNQAEFNYLLNSRKLLLIELPPL